MRTKAKSYFHVHVKSANGLKFRARACAAWNRSVSLVGNGCLSPAPSLRISLSSGQLQTQSLLGGLLIKSFHTLSIEPKYEYVGCVL